jgi:large subunit ribosomal protein L29
MANIVELREMTTAKLEAKLEDAREELFNLRFQRASGRLEDYSRLREVRREIAQLQELLHKRQLAAEAAAQHPQVAAALAGKTWSAIANFSYEDSAWNVQFTDDDGRDLASAKVNLNQAKLSGRRARRSKPQSQLVTSYVIAGK